MMQSITNEPLSLVSWRDPILFKPVEPCRAVTKGSEAWRSDEREQFRAEADDWLREAYRVQGEMKRIAEGMRAHGLAAPQLGVPMRLIIVTDTPGRGYRAFVEPTIISRAPERKTEIEGCLSFPGLSLRVKRAKSVTIGCTTKANGELVPVAFQARGRLARVIQHEIDHLDGKTIADRCIAADREKFAAWTRRQDEKKGRVAR